MNSFTIFLVILVIGTLLVAAGVAVWGPQSGSEAATSTARAVRVTPGWAGFYRGAQPYQVVLPPRYSVPQTPEQSGAVSQSSYAQPAQSAQPAAAAPAYQSRPHGEPPPGFTESQLSVFYKKVRIGYLSPSASFGYAGRFSLYTTSDTPIEVSGWRLRANRGEVVIPLAVSDYNPTIYTSTEAPISLVSGGEVSVSGDFSPISRSIRLNKCAGYLNNHAVFRPELPRQCPYVSQRDISRFSGKCQSFISSLGGCREPAPNELNAFGFEPECINYVRDTASYGACYREHRWDSDFFKDTWYVWLGSALPFDPQHDRVLLFDAGGRVVDEYLY